MLDFGPFQVNWADTLYAFRGGKLTAEGVEPVGLPQAPAQVAVDGDLSEWTAVPPLAVRAGSRKGCWVKMCWNRRGIYGAMTAKDAAITSNPQMPWKADTLQMVVQAAAAPDGGGEAVVCQTAFSPVPGSEGRGGILSATSRSRAAAPAVGRDAATGLACAWARSGDGYVLEFLLPGRFLGLTQMRPGLELRMDFAQRDNGRPVMVLKCNPKSREWRRPSAWQVVRLAQ